MEAENNQLHGIYETEDDLKAEMNRLKDQGYADSDMYIVTYENQRLAMYRGTEEYDENAHEEASWWDRFKAFMLGEDTARDEHFNHMGISHEDRDRYYEDLRTGKYLLYVDKDYGSYFDEHVSRGEARNFGGEATKNFDRDATRNDATEPYDEVTNHKTRDEPRDLNSALSKTKPIGYDPDDPAGSTAMGPDEDRLHESKPVGYNNEETVLGRNDDTTLDRNDSVLDRNDTTLDRDNTTLGRDDTTLGGTGRLDRDSAQTEEERLALHEERLEVDKKRVQAGEVQVDKNVVEEQKTVDVPVEREEVHVERRPVTDNDVSNENDPQQKHAYEEDGSIHIPVTKEEVEVKKKDVVTEEIVVSKEKVQDTETVSETVRREEADIHRTDDEDTTEHLTDRDKRDNL